MKKLITSIAASVLSILAAHSAPPIDFAVGATFDLSAITQGQPAERSKTNVTATGTNIISFINVPVNTSNFTSSNLLALIENSYNTNFPVGSHIAMDNYSYGLPVIVLDPTGTNILLTPSNIITSVFTINNNDRHSFTNIATFDGFLAIRYTRVENTNGVSDVGNFIQDSYYGYLLTYDDTSLTPKDSKHSQFQFTGLYVDKLTYIARSHSTKETGEIQGTGGGMVDGVDTLLTGTISLK